MATEGFTISDRTVQRDLQQLSEVFPLTVDDREKPFGWSWQKDAKSFDLPGLTLSEALTWVMARQHLEHLLPASLCDHLAPHFRAAHERLDQEPAPQHGHNWLNKVRIVPPTQPLIPPSIDEGVHRAVSEALLKERQLDIRYRSKGKMEASSYRAHPLALIQRGPVLYLYARLFDYPDLRTLAMHRIESATVLDETCARPANFDVDCSIAQGVWGFGGGKSLQLRCRFFDGKGEHLQETPLSNEQHIALESGDGQTLSVFAEVPDTPQLRWWLLGFGDGVEVIEPASLRSELQEMVRRMLARYSPPSVQD